MIMIINTRVISLKGKYNDDYNAHAWRRVTKCQTNLKQLHCGKKIYVLTWNYESDDYVDDDDQRLLHAGSQQEVPTEATERLRP